MIRPWQTWLLFGLCLVVVLAAMGWVSLAVLRLDRAEREARRQAAVEENVRLALWRMDSALSPLIARESARPYFTYSPFYPAERAYTRMFAPIPKGYALIPSPLLTYASPYTVVHFQIGPDGTVTSPQIPSGTMRDLAEASYVAQDDILDAEGHLNALRALLDRDRLLAALPREEPSAQAAVRVPAQQGDVPQYVRMMANNNDLLPNAAAIVAQQEQQRVRSQDEWNVRAGRQVANQAVARGGDNALRIVSKGKAASKSLSSRASAPVQVQEGAIEPLLLGDALVLARRVCVDGKEYVQGCQLNWPAIRAWLLADIRRDLFPAARLVLAPADGGDAQARRLAALPVRFVPGPIAATAAAIEASPLRLSLVAAWVCAILAVAAVAGLLRGAVSLSERRAAFVSAVTHELRTPLTTFRMYAEMLSEGMVQDPEKRRQYLETLRAEADRLGHLVENVLAYARLERGSARGRAEDIRVRDLIDRVRDRLAARARQGDMDLAVEAPESALDVTVHADGSAVEQVLFNLVDNACKYAGSAEDRRVHLTASRRNGAAILRVRDHGPGIRPGESHRLFLPFHKSADEAAASAPGVGLGLALSRRLARRMRGELSLDASVTDGAAFVLRLPAGRGK